VTIRLKRLDLERHIHFVTSKTKDNTPIFSDKETAELFLAVLFDCRKKYKFLLFGFVIMPDHFHALIKPDRDYSISMVMQKIKSLFAYRYRELTGISGSIWQKSFYDFVLNSKEKLIEKLNYIHNNPIRENIVSSPKDYPYSSYKILNQLDLNTVL